MNERKKIQMFLQMLVKLLSFFIDFFISIAISNDRYGITYFKWYQKILQDWEIIVVSVE